MSADVHVDIIIIGAGISGMVAAYDILQHEPTLKVLILEAKGRIGGRTFTVPIETNSKYFVPIDLGGHWISSEQKLLLKLIEKLGLTLIPQYKSGVALADIGSSQIYTFQDHPIIGNIYCQYELKRFFTKLEALSEQCSSNNVSKNGDLDCISMEDYIQKNLFTNVSRNIARTVVRTTCGIEPSQVSVFSYMVFCNGSNGFTNLYMTSDGGAREFWLKEGAQEICKRISKKLDTDSLLMKTPVLKIRHDDKEVTIVTPTKTYKCSYAIIAIPPREIIKINFQPMLTDDKCNIFLQVQNEHLTKFVISYKENFWKRQGFSGEIFSCGEGPIRLCYDSTKNDIPMLTGFIYDVKNREKPHRGQVILQLFKYWGREALTPIQYIEKNWNEEIYNGSCPTSRPLLNCMRDCEKISEPLGRIHWAGTETATVWNGYMEGAVQSGHRASMEVLYQLRPQSLSFRDMVHNQCKNVHRKRLFPKWYLTICSPYWSPIIGAALVTLIVLYNKYS